MVYVLTNEIFINYLKYNHLLYLWGVMQGVFTRLLP